MQRLVTLLFLVPLALAAVFLLPERWFLLFVILFLDLTALELVRIGRVQAPGAPLRALLLLVPLAIVVLAAALNGSPGWPADGAMVLALLLAPGTALILLFGRTPVEQSLVGLGLLVFGTLYLAVPGAAVWELQRRDPWLVVLVIAVVAANDSLAFWIGSRFGRHKMSPRISPKKSWEGAVAGFAGGLAAAGVWVRPRPGEPAVAFPGSAPGRRRPVRRPGGVHAQAGSGSQGLGPALARPRGPAGPRRRPVAGRSHSAGGALVPGSLKHLRPATPLSGGSADDVG